MGITHVRALQGAHENILCGPGSLSIGSLCKPGWVPATIKSDQQAACHFIIFVHRQGAVVLGSVHCTSLPLPHQAFIPGNNNVVQRCVARNSPKLEAIDTA